MSQCYYFNGSVHVGTFPAEVEQSNNRKSNGKPVDEGDIVDEAVHVCGGEVDEGSDTLQTSQPHAIMPHNIITSITHRFCRFLK